MKAKAINPKQSKIMRSLGFRDPILKDDHVIWYFKNTGPMVIHGLTIELEKNNMPNPTVIIANVYYQAMIHGRDSIKRDINNLLGADDIDADANDNDKA